MSSQAGNRFLPPQWVVLLCFALFARILATAFVPIMDQTEARYAEIARKMVETNDWITPQYDYGVPFWAKPPLSTWLSALSMRLLGVNEFAARLPSILIALAIFALIFRFSGRERPRHVRQTAVIILATMGMFYVAMGTVMTDMELLFACTLALVAFWRTVEDNSRRWGYVFFAALGIGLLAKGPIALVLCGASIVGWLIWTKEWKKTISNFPILNGTLLMLVIAVPWYVLAEEKTPGFLEYFIVGEHFKRFLVPGWKGDLYGHAHGQRLGTDWAFLLLDSLPWSVILLGLWASRYLRKEPVTQMHLDRHTKFLLCWLFFPNLFFTFTSNIIPTYPLVSLPALALLIADGLAPVMIQNGKLRVWVSLSAGLLPVLTIVALPFVALKPERISHTAFFVSRAFQKAVGPGHDLVYIGPRIYSMEFYNGGKVRRYDTVEKAVADAGRENEIFLVLDEKQSTRLPADLTRRMKVVAKAPHYQIVDITPDQTGTPIPFAR